MLLHQHELVQCVFRSNSSILISTILLRSNLAKIKYLGSAAKGYKALCGTLISSNLSSKVQFQNCTIFSGWRFPANLFQFGILGASPQMELPVEAKNQSDQIFKCITWINIQVMHLINLGSTPNSKPAIFKLQSPWLYAVPPNEVYPF